MNKDDIVKNLKINSVVTVVIIIFMICIPVFGVRGMTIPKNKVEESIMINSKGIKNIEIDRFNVVKVYISSENEVKELPIDEYLYGVVSSEMSPTFNQEALKAQAIAARTFVINKLNNKCPNANGADICDTVHCQVYRDKDMVLKNWNDEKRNEYWENIRNAVDSTSGMVITYNDEIIKYPQFFSTSSGKTENCKDVFSSHVPYLVSVESKGDEVSNSYKSSLDIELNEFIDIINREYEEANLNIDTVKNEIIIKGRSEAGGVTLISIGDINIKGTELRKLLGLKSTNFTFRFDNNKIIFDCTGYGHGVGMSQWGANAMGKEGATYDQILNHYYTGTNIGKVKFNN